MRDARGEKTLPAGYIITRHVKFPPISRALIATPEEVPRLFLLIGVCLGFFQDSGVGLGFDMPGLNLYA